MTDAEQNAAREIKIMKRFNSAFQKEDHHAALTRKIFKFGATLKDKDGNNIADFFKDNGLDNHNFKKGMLYVNKSDMGANIKDTIKAIQGDTQTLLNE